MSWVLLTSLGISVYYVNTLMNIWSNIKYRSFVDRLARFLFFLLLDKYYCNIYTYQILGSFKSHICLKWTLKYKRELYVEAVTLDPPKHGKRPETAKDSSI